MIPLYDNVPSRRAPVVTAGLIAANVVIFLVGRNLPERLQHAQAVLYGLTPIRYSDPGLAAQFAFGEQFLPFFSYMFLHGGWFHLLSNVWFLWIFGDNVEERLGRFRFLVFYLAAGVSAGLVHLATNWGSELPTVGASGAIAGVMGAYSMLFPGARVVTLVPLILFYFTVELPAALFLGFWFFLQLLSGVGSIGMGDVGGVAWWAHVGGFLAGMHLVHYFIAPGPAIEYRPARRPWAEPDDAGWLE